MTRAVPSRARPAALLALLAPAALGAQIFKVAKKSDEPQFSGSIGVGVFRSQSVLDGTTESQWLIERGAQYRGALEYVLKGGSAVGIVATHARLPFEYRGTCLVAGDATTPCVDDGDLTVQSLSGAFHGGGSNPGVRGVLDAGLGYTWYRDFQTDHESAGSPRLPEGADRDFSFFFSTGFGYGVSKRLGLELVQDFGFVRHQGEGLSSNDRTTTQQRVTRFTVRYGFGNRRAGI